MANQIIQSIKTIAQSLVDKAGYDKTRGGVIVSINSATNTYSVKVDGVTYPIVRAVDGATYNVGDVVKVVIPCNQATQMYIASSVLSDNSLGNKISNAVGLAQDAAKVATNYIEQDDTDGLIFGDKTSGTWSGYHSQILSDRFNILDESSTVLASFGTTTVIGEEAKANMHLTFNNLSMVDKNGTKFFEVGDNRNAEGIATVEYKDTGYVYPDTGSAVVVVYSRILSIVSVYVDSVELSSSEYSFSGQKVTINNLTPNTNIYVEITYTTLSPYFYLTFGNRLPSSEIGMYSVAEGRDVTASGYASHAEGMDTIASDQYSHAEGCETTASAGRAHAEGMYTIASGSDSHAEGYNTTASSGGAHAEGRGTTASHSGAHAEGGGTTANGNYSHAEGYYTIASVNYSHAEGYYTTASGLYSHAGGYYTKADGNYMTAIGKYNTEKSGKAFVIGNGTSTARSNAFAVDWSGNVYMSLGDCTITDSGTALSVTNGASTLDGLLAQAIIDTFSYANAKEILDMPGDENINVKKLLQKIVEKLKR